MDFFMNQIAGILDRFADKIPNVNIPFHRVGEYMDVLKPYFNQANSLFPVDTLLTCLGILAALRGALLVVWVVKFIRGLLPF